MGWSVSTRASFSEFPSDHQSSLLPGFCRVPLRRLHLQNWGFLGHVHTDGLQSLFFPFQPPNTAWGQDVMGTNPQEQRKDQEPRSLGSSSSLSGSGEHGVKTCGLDRSQETVQVSDLWMKKWGWESSCVLFKDSQPATDPSHIQSDVKRWEIVFSLPQLTRGSCLTHLRNSWE